MRSARVRALIVTAIAMCGLASGLSFASAGSPSAPAAAPATRSSHVVPTRHACQTPASGFLSCDVELRTDIKTSGGSSRSAALAAGPSGFTPADLASAYKFGVGTGQLVAIIDAFDDPNAESDLAIYRAKFDLPPCVTSSGCFKKIDQKGGTKYPKANKGWTSEIALDLDMVSAVCPGCQILLVEANSDSIKNLMSAVSRATKLGAKVVSMSFGGPEFSTESGFDQSLNKQGIAYAVAAGDLGYGVQWPAASPYVTAVGGTTLANGPAGWTETAWRDAGSGCSKYEPAPPWEVKTACSLRAVADVSAVADPATGVATYDSYGSGGWVEAGGTSVAAPIIAGLFALAPAPAPKIYAALYPWTHQESLFDVTTGSNGTCKKTILCTAGGGWDGPTGLGSPRGRVPFDSAGGQAQNAYQYVDWEFTGTGFSSIDQDIRVTRKANATTWAQTWSWTDSDTGGYIGLQTAGERFDGTKGDTAIFSLWDALAAQGPGCGKFFGEGEGWSCRLAFKINKGRYYKLKLMRIPSPVLASTGQWWEARILDEKSGVESLVGDLEVASSHSSARPPRNFTEYFGPTVPCDQVPLSIIDWTQPAANYLGGGAYEWYSSYAPPADRGACTGGTVTTATFGGTQGVVSKMGGKR